VSDFRTQFVTKTIPATGGVGTTNTVTSQAPADFAALDDQSAGLLIPACTLNTAGIGYTAGTINNGLLQQTAMVGFDDADTITWVEGYQAAIGRTNLCGAQILEYLGPGNGINAIVVRADVTVTMAAGVTTADSSGIAGIVSLGNCVPFGFSYGDENSGNYRSHLAKWDLVNTGSANVVRVTRALGNANCVVRVRVVEFIGAGWSVQKVAHTFAASATNEDATITAVTVAKSFTYTTFMPTGTSTPAEENLFVWLAGTTTLRHRVTTKSSTGQSCITWVVSNPQLAVATYGTINGTAEYTATGGNPDTVNVTITAVPDITQALVIGYAGSNSTASTSLPSAWWLCDLTTTTNLRMRRTGHATAANRGDTEYLLQVIDFSGVASTRIDSVAAITDGSSFVISGLFTAGSTVTHGGDSVTITNQTTSALTCTGAIGKKTYGDAYPLVVSDGGGGTAAVNVSVAPASGTRYVNLQGMPPMPSVRLTASPDFVGTEQVRWLSSDVAGTAMTSADVEVLTNGVIRRHPAVTSAKFSANARDGQGWGVTGTQTFQQSVVAVPTLVTPVPNLLCLLTVPQQINIGQYATGWTSVSLIGTLPTGLTFSGGIITGTPTQAGVFSLTVRYSNSSGNTDDVFTLEAIAVGTGVRVRQQTTTNGGLRRRRYV
jgi:hypothetical protein